MMGTFLIVTGVVAIVAFFTRNRTINHLIVFGYYIYLTFFAAYLTAHIGELFNEYFQADYLGMIFLFITIIISLVAAIHYVKFASSRNVTPEAVALHNAGTIFFTGSVAGVLLSAHFGVLWAFVEATTLGASVMIYHNRNRDSLEATWKYIFICSIGVAIAFAGVLFLGLASQEAGLHDITFSGVRSVAATLKNSSWLKVCFLLVVTGFSVKMGLVPLFNVDIDAKDASPSPVGACLSSIMMNTGFVAIFRFYESFSVSSILPWMNNVLLITGISSIFFAGVYALKVKNIKRLFAYSSMEHAGLAIIAFSCGGIGYFAAVFHLVIHSFAKSTLFFQVSQIHRIFNSKLDEGIGDYFSINPLGGFVLLLGFISIIALPPSGLFISEFMMFQALMTRGLWWVLIIVVVCILLVIYGLATRVLGMLFMRKNIASINIKGIARWESVIQLLLIGLVYYLGLFRPLKLVDAIHMAIEKLPI